MATSAEPRSGGLGRLLPLSGVVSVALILIGVVGLGGDTPGSEESGAVINSFYDAHRGRQFAAAFVVAASVPLMVIFGVSLALALWPADNRRALWQVVLALGSALTGMAFIIAAFVHFALTDLADQRVLAGPGLAALNVLDADSWILFNSALGVMMLGAAGSLLSRRAIPVLGWIALLAGVALFIPFADFFGLIVSGLWIIVTSIVLFRRGSGFARATA